MSENSRDLERGAPLDILARTLYGEARGEYARLDGGISALVGVANVVMNRLKAGGRYGASIADVCQKPFQFSCWNEHDPNRDLVMHPTITDPVFTVCCEVATKVASGDWPDLTKGSNHYHTISSVPGWARHNKPRVRLGQHLFYHLS